MIDQYLRPRSTHDHAPGDERSTYTPTIEVYAIRDHKSMPWE